MKTLLQITFLLFLFGCKSKQEIVETTNTEIVEVLSDSLVKENKQLKEVNTFLKDSVSQLNKIIEKTEKEIIKATQFKTKITSICDSLGNLKEINQTFGSDNHKVNIKTENGGLVVESKQIKDFESVIKTLETSNETYVLQIKELESKHSKETTELKAKLVESKQIIEELKSKDITQIVWSKWTYIFLLSTIILLFIVIWSIKDKLISFKNILTFWK